MPTVSKWALVGTVAGLMLVAGGVGWAQDGAHPDTSSHLANTLTDIGLPVPLGATAVLSLMSNEREQRAGRQAADAILVTGAATELLKRLVRADRPDNPDAHDGFPSGHASLNFAFARALASEYQGWGNAAYVFAAGVTWSRVRREDHTIAQALTGAALGWYIADRSVHSRGGLLNGLIVEKRNGLVGAVTPVPGGVGVEMWRASW